MINPSIRLLNLALGHIVHGFLLLAPTLFLASAFDLKLVGFACILLLAGVLECCQTLRLTNQSKHRFVACKPKDLTALKVAQVVGALMLCLFWMAQIESFYFARNFWTLSSFGLILSTMGISLRLVAIHTLGTRFQSDIIVPSEIEAGGIYRWLKHPSEFGLLLIVVGVPLILCSVATSVAAIAVLVPVSIWRMRREDNELAKYSLKTSIPDQS